MKLEIKGLIVMEGHTRKRKRKNRKKIKLVLFLIVLIIIGIIVVIPWALKPENLGGLKDNIVEVFRDGKFKESYNAKSLVLTDLSNDENFIYKKAEEQQIPASLAKLYVLEYASTLVNLEDIVQVNPEAIALTKEGSSVANIKEQRYSIRNLFAAMLVPSGNDASYVLADYCGNLLSPEAKTSKERIDSFMQNLNIYLQESGYVDTILYDPSGFDTEARTTVLDLKKVAKRLLEFQWFREIVFQASYTAILPDGTTQTWKNTNTFLDPLSEYYNENVMGIKTGSLLDDYNLVVLYKMHGKEFLICSLGSQSNSSRYDDVNYILKTIDESDYLKSK